MVFRVVPLGGAGADEQLWDVPLVHVAPDRTVGGRPELARSEENLVALDQLAGHLDSLGRRIAGVAGDEVDLAAVYAALIVDHLEISGHRYRNGAGVRQRATIGAGVADLDLRGGS